MFIATVIETEDDTLRVLVGDTDKDCVSDPFDVVEWQPDTEGLPEDDGDENEDGDALTERVFIATETVTVDVALRVRVEETERVRVGEVDEVVDWHFVTEGLPVRVLDE